MHTDESIDISYAENVPVEFGGARYLRVSSDGRSIEASMDGKTWFMTGRVWA
jgi:hypothetical protein